MTRRQLLLLLALTTAAPAAAQPTDPFEGIVGTSDLTSRLRTVLPEASPDADAVRAYLRGVEAFSLSLDAELDDGRGGRVTRLGDGGAVATGTRLRVNAGFSETQDGKGAVLTRLSVAPTRPLSFGDARLHRIDLDGQGNLKVRLHHGDRAVDLKIHKIHRDRAGNLVFRTEATNLGLLGNQFVPDFRITADGRVQTRAKPGLLRRNPPWEQARDRQGKPVSIGRAQPLTQWPPRFADLLPLFEGQGEGRRGAFLGSIPVGDVALSADATLGPTMLRPKSEAGWVALRSGEIALRAHGRVNDGRFVPDPERANHVKVKAKLDGVVKAPPLEATLYGLEVDARVDFAKPARDARGALGALGATQ